MTPDEAQKAVQQYRHKAATQTPDEIATTALVAANPRDYLLLYTAALQAIVLETR